MFTETLRYESSCSCIQPWGGGGEVSVAPASHDAYADDKKNKQIV